MRRMLKTERSGSLEYYHGVRVSSSSLEMKMLISISGDNFCIRFQRGL